jgi:putative ABC transport system substrate-binding protein
MTSVMDRRAFIGLAAGGLLTAPLAAEAQQVGKVYRIGLLWNTPNPPMEEVLRRCLRELGWVEGQNFILERRYSEGRNDRHPVLAAELVRLQPDLIITAGTFATLAPKGATTTIPVVFVTVFDPVGTGVVESLARPGRNLTGTAAGAGPELAGKYLELLKEAIPSLSRIGIFTNSLMSSHANARPHLEAAGRRLGLTLSFVEVRTPEDLDGAFATVAREKLPAALASGDPMWFVLRGRVAKLALDNRVALMVYSREAVEAGALMSYFDPAVWHVRRMPFYIDRILKGAKPADLPVEQPTELTLTINLKTAKALGLTIPPSLLARADQVIE